MSDVPFQIRIDDTGESFHCSSQQSLLSAMESLGRKGIPVGCRGGGCGVCKVRVRIGMIRAGKMSRLQVSEEEQLLGIVLACRAFPVSDLSLSVVGKMKKNLCKERLAPWRAGNQ